MNRTNQIDLAAIGARLANTTPGPWGLCNSTDARSGGYVRPCGPDATREDGSRPAVCRINTTGHDAATWRANARFIEHAREDVPALLAEIERVRSLADAALRDHGAALHENEAQAMIDALRAIRGTP